MSLYTMSVELWSDFVPCFHVFCAHFSLGFEEKSVENEYFHARNGVFSGRTEGQFLKMFRAVLCFSFCLISDKAEEFSAENSPCMSLQREAIQNPWMRRSENCVLCLTIEKRTNLPVESSIRNCVFCLTIAFLSDTRKTSKRKESTACSFSLLRTLHA